MKWLLRFMAFIVTCLSAELIAGSGEPKPTYIAVPYGIVTASIWSLPLWASTFELRSKWRFAVAALVLATGVVTSFVMLAYNMVVFGFVVAIHLALLAVLLKPRRRP